MVLDVITQGNARFINDSIANGSSSDAVNYITLASVRAQLEKLSKDELFDLATYCQQTASEPHKVLAQELALKDLNSGRFNKPWALYIVEVMIMGQLKQVTTEALYDQPHYRGFVGDFFANLENRQAEGGWQRG